MTAYQQKAQEIIKESIKSAIFIDEKAWMPYENASTSSVTEEVLSKKLYTNFKDNNISLAVHKFVKGDENGKYEDYLFGGRDLVLLDWKLDGINGEEYALKLLAEVVNKPNIHFCCIYTFDSKPDDVLSNILSYFSGEKEEKYDEIKENLAEYQEEIEDILPDIKTISFYRDTKSRVKEIMGKLKSTSEKRELIKAISNECQENDICSLIKVGIAFEKFKKPNKIQPCPELVVPENYVIVIKNTIISILNKEYDTDSVSLLDKIANQIVNSQQSFTQLLGLEMQNLTKKRGSFIDKNLIEVNIQTLLHHRKQTLESDLKTDLPFKDLIKDILFEHLKLGLSSESLNLLEEDILDELSSELVGGQVESVELIKLNTFYNSSYLSKEGQQVNFGDVFFYEIAGERTYFICITALCDCLRPEKIDNLFYFAKGTRMTDKETALKLGDTAFISFLPNSEIVRWSEIETGKDHIAKYKPIYIKPIQIKISDNKINSNHIEIKQISTDCQNIDTHKLTYITTIKPNYAQRIANHAFAHPIRVGVDFVKK